MGNRSSTLQSFGSEDRSVENQMHATGSVDLDENEDF